MAEVNSSFEKGLELTNRRHSLEKDGTLDVHTADLMSKESLVISSELTGEQRSILRHYAFSLDFIQMVRDFQTED